MRSAWSEHQSILVDGNATFDGTIYDDDHCCPYDPDDCDQWLQDRYSVSVKIQDYFRGRVTVYGGNPLGASNKVSSVSCLCDSCQETYL